MKSDLLIRILAGLVLCGIPQTVLASCAARVVVRKAVVVEKKAVVVEKAIVVPVAVAAVVPVAVPVYSVGYTPPVLAPQAGLSDAQLDILAQRIEARLALRSGEPKKEVLQVTAHADVQKVLSARCAECHTGDRAKGKFQMFAGPDVLAELSKAQRAHIVLMAEVADMPPAAKGDPKSAAAVTDQELGTLKEWARQKAGK